MRTIGFDTNVLITLKLEREPGFKKARALLKRCLDGKITLYISLPVFLETEWVLRSFYKYPKDKIIEYFEELLKIENLITDKKKEIQYALSLFKELKELSFTDCIILRLIQSEGYEFLTFDKKLEKLYHSL